MFVLPSAPRLSLFEGPSVLMASLLIVKIGVYVYCHVTL